MTLELGWPILFGKANSQPIKKYISYVTSLVGKYLSSPWIETSHVFRIKIAFAVSKASIYFPGESFDDDFMTLTYASSYWQITETL